MLIKVGNRYINTAQVACFVCDGENENVIICYTDDVECTIQGDDAVGLLWWLEHTATDVAQAYKMALPRSPER